MYVDKLSLKNFRNYENGYVEFKNGINLIYGPNAMGKTNILEAIYYFSTARSHRLATTNEMIKFGCDFAKITAEFKTENRINKGEIILFPDKKKQIKINKVPVEKTSELMSFLKVVLFCPEDLNLVKGSPKIRRRMMDLGICRLKQKYFHSLVEYTKVLQQKNKLLKDNKNIDMLWVWNEKLVTSGAEVIWYRKNYIDKLSKISKQINFDISDDELEIFYVPGVNITDFSHKGKIEEDFRIHLEKTEEREKNFGVSLIGPHRDDFEIKVNSREARTFGSQGQQRTAALSLKMAELNMVKEVSGQNPILLLDDVLSELDSKRQDYILKKIKDTQVIITSTDSEKFDSLCDVNKINVESVR